MDSRGTPRCSAVFDFSGNREENPGKMEIDNRRSLSGKKLFSLEYIEAENYRSPKSRKRHELLWITSVTSLAPSIKSCSRYFYQRCKFYGCICCKSSWNRSVFLSLLMFWTDSILVGYQFCSWYNDVRPGIFNQRRVSSMIVNIGRQGAESESRTERHLP